MGILRQPLLVLVVYNTASAEHVMPHLQGTPVCDPRALGNHAFRESSYPFCFSVQAWKSGCQAHGVLRCFPFAGLYRISWLCSTAEQSGKPRSCLVASG